MKNVVTGLIGALVAMTIFGVTFTCWSVIQLSIADRRMDRETPTAIALIAATYGAIAIGPAAAACSILFRHATRKGRVPGEARIRAVFLAAVLGAAGGGVTTATTLLSETMVPLAAAALLGAVSCVGALIATSVIVRVEMADEANRKRARKSVAR